MIGDRKHDAEAGQANNIATVGVLWGYGSTDELTTAGVDHLAETPAALLHVIGNIQIQASLYNAQE
jgi:phosphoglycolate phosphatase